MHCEDARPLIGSYLDGELDLVRNLEIEDHVKDCPDCSPVYRSELDLRSAIREEISYHRAPKNLERRVRLMVREAGNVRPRVAVLSWRWAGMAAALMLVAFVSARVATLRMGPSQEELLTEEIIAGHVRSLMASHLTDVASTDQHTVKPWFHGKLDFAPPVVDLADESFPLVGGRLDYIDHRSVAALVYQRRLHSINLFIWPTPGKSEQSVSAETRDGYNILHWTRGGMTYCAISDLANNEMQPFAMLLQK